MQYCRVSASGRIRALPPLRPHKVAKLLECASPPRPAIAQRRRLALSFRREERTAGLYYGGEPPKRQPPSRRSGALARRGGGRAGALHDADAPADTPRPGPPEGAVSECTRKHLAAALWLVSLGEFGNF